MASISLYSERPIRMELSPVAKEQQQKFVNMAKASVLKVKKIFSMEKPHAKMTQKEHERAYFMMYAAVADRETMNKTVPMRMKDGEKFQAPVADVVDMKLGGIKEATKERLMNWQVAFTNGLQERIPEVSLSKQRELGKSVEKERAREKQTNFSLDNADFDLD